jgi:hypothetical protein
MRWPLAFAITLTLACEPPLPARELPVLEPAPTPTAAPNLRAMWIPGESLAWEVHSKSVPIGTAILTTSDGRLGPMRIRTRFVPEGWLAHLRVLRHDLVTTGNKDADAHTLHSMIGWLRAWSHPDNAPAILRAKVGKERYRVSVATPLVERGQDSTLRVDMTALSDDQRLRIEATLWLTHDRRRIPTRLDLRFGARRVTATLITDR